jgi:hypothetical protein
LFLLFLLLSFFAVTDFAWADEPLQPESRALAAKEAELARLQTEIAELRAKLNIGDPMIAVHVRTFRLRRSALRRAGVDVDRGLLASQVGKPPADERLRHLDAAMLPPNDAFYDRLESWRTDPAKLAEPLVDTRLVTRSKVPVYMNSGGEIPIVVPQAFGKMTVEYRRYGSQLDATPELLDDGRVRLAVRPRSSELDPSHSVTIDGTKLPGLRVAELDLTVELKPKEVLAVAGLIQHREAKGGAYEETELLTLVSVELVAPGEAVDLMSTSAEKPFGRAAVGGTYRFPEPILRTSAEGPAGEKSAEASGPASPKPASAPEGASRASSRPPFLPRRGR